MLTHTLMRARACDKGFTLIELLVALAVLALFLGLGVPSFANVLAKYKATDHAQNLFIGLQYARAEAVKRGHTVTICGSNDAHTCSKIWRGQLLVFDDQNNDSQADPSEIIRIENFHLNNDYLISSLARGVTFVKFKADGQAETAGSLIYCRPDNLENSKMVTFQTMGRAYFAPLTIKNGRLLNRYQNDLNCE